MLISIRKARVPVAELTFTDESAVPKWRAFSGYHLAPGTSRGTGNELIWSVSPGEWTVLGERPDGIVVDLTHVRAMFRLTGASAADLISRVCALDLSDGMFPDGAVARTLFAGVATELVRDDADGAASYLVVPSSSFAVYIRAVIADAGEEFDLSV